MNAPFNETAERDALIADWDHAQKQLAQWKEKEMALRVKLTEANYGNTVGKSGTENIELNNGWKLKTVFAQRISIPTGKEGEAVKKVCEQLTAIDPEQAKFIIPRLFKWQPDLSITEYKQLPPNFRRIVDKIVTTKDAAVSVELVPPKGQA